ncbi:metal ABC transporter substrate-binding protein [Sulfurimonas sp.]|uniref:metal ABC transporter substrate-binding protein n=1 Tax=Sulfurimonas sp. TaxID=2022749 RepID=UPI0026094262|nr:metal ABC transporter substrate-binding protein [Sulfurimonas sp.]
MKNLKIIFVVLFVAIVAIFLFISMEKEQAKQSKPIVGVTTFALYDITKHIAGDTVNLVNILPFGVDPHSFEPTPKLMVKIAKSRLVFYSGAGLEPWIANFQFKGKAVNISKYVDLRELKSNGDGEQAVTKQNMHTSSLDPHYWLDFSNMQKATAVITKDLIALMPENKKLYLQNEQKYIKMLQGLNTLYKKTLTSCKNDTVVISHNALGYLANKYHFKVQSLTGLSPEAEPSAQDVNRIFKDIKSEGLDTIFFENFVNDKLIKSIAHDAKIKFELFEPLGTITADEAKAGLTYEDIMKINLKKLAKALQCH